MQENATSQQSPSTSFGEQASRRAVVLGDGALRIVFQQRGDRFGHRIAIANPSGLITLLESVESAAEVAWPHSPPLQELEVEPRGGNQKVSLLVGMAGTSHWSASVEVDANSLRFDIACRTRDATARLGSTYLVADGILAQQDHGTVLIQTRDARVAVKLSSHADVSTQFILLDNRRLWIGPDVEIDKTPTTVRWKYSLCLCQG